LGIVLAGGFKVIVTRPLPLRALFFDDSQSRVIIFRSIADDGRQIFMCLFDNYSFQIAHPIPYIKSWQTICYDLGAAVNSKATNNKALTIDFIFMQSQAYLEGV
jgi:hypothetical protein